MSEMPGSYEELPKEEIYPRYQIFVDGEEEWHDAHTTARLLNSWTVPTCLGEIAQDSETEPRLMSEAERFDIYDRSDDFSGNK